MGRRHVKADWDKLKYSIEPPGVLEGILIPVGNNDVKVGNYEVGRAAILPSFASCLGTCIRVMQGNACDIPEMP